MKVVNTSNSERLHYLREQSKPVKHVSYDPTGAFLAASCTDGNIYIYDMTTDQPHLVHRVDGLIPAVDMESDTRTEAVWHPDGRAFAVATQTRGDYTSYHWCRRVLTDNPCRSADCVGQGLGHAEDFQGRAQQRHHRDGVVAKRCPPCHRWPRSEDLSMEHESPDAASNVSQPHHRLSKRGSANTHQCGLRLYSSCM